MPGDRFGYDMRTAQKTYVGRNRKAGPGLNLVFEIGCVLHYVECVGSRMYIFPP